MEYTLNLCNNKTISMDDIDTDKLDKFIFSIHCKNITLDLIRSLNLDPKFLVFNRYVDDNLKNKISYEYNRVHSGKNYKL